MTDVRLFHTADGGDIAFSGDDLVAVDILLDSGLETAAYLSLLGGNERDPGLVGNIDPEGADRFQWWGNIGEPRDRQQRSETQHLLRSLPATSNNLLRLEDAATRDLQWFVDTDIASLVEVSATLATVNTVVIAVRIVVTNKDFAFAFTARWAA